MARRRVDRPGDHEAPGPGRARQVRGARRARLLLALLKNAEGRAEDAEQQKLDAIATALVEQRRGNETAAEDELAEAIGPHDEV